MKRFSTRHGVSHSASDMFALVADVEAYPQFVPLCSSLRVRSRNKDGEGRELVVADMTVAYKLIRETYTSRILLNEPALTIDVSNIDGPFERLENAWAFHPVEANSCEVEFNLIYGFKSRTFEAVAGLVFDRAFSHFSESFEKRADVIYGHAV
ncbi:MAG: type II toxin-antitoxin system RatA family toxin [Rhodobiaceae bacterium]|nr:type II toxin-antitoxin system RatA family toxin [Rhodobiaceae bacterium]MCC0062330.1 type II toxin-antitoxin system RatA family toxin [Rhodobiaceae bacterium]